MPSSYSSRRMDVGCDCDPMVALAQHLADLGIYGQPTHTTTAGAYQLMYRSSSQGGTSAQCSSRYCNGSPSQNFHGQQDYEYRASYSQAYYYSAYSHWDSHWEYDSPSSSSRRDRAYSKNQSYRRDSTACCFQRHLRELTSNSRSALHHYGPTPNLAYSQHHRGSEAHTLAYHGSSVYASGSFDSDNGGGESRTTSTADLPQQSTQQASTSGHSQDSAVDDFQDGSVPVLRNSEEISEAVSEVGIGSVDETVIAEPVAKRPRVESFSLHRKYDILESVSYGVSFPRTWKPPLVFTDQGIVGKNASNTPTQSALLACPYIKHDPSRYIHEYGCRGAAYSTIHRLKEHLRRKHKQPPNCLRCHAIFKTQTEVENHLKAQALCEVIEGEGFVHGFNAAQAERLFTKKRSIGVETQVDKWKEIFKILFPGQKDVPNPFYQIHFDDQDMMPQPSTGEQGDYESIFTQHVSSMVKDEIYAEMELAIGRSLSQQERRRLLDVFMRFAIKIPHPSTQRNATERRIHRTPKSLEVKDTNGTTHSIEARGKRRLLKTVEEKLDEKLGEVDANPQSNQAIELPMDQFTALEFWPAEEGAEHPAVYPESALVDFGSDFTYEPGWEAHFPDASGGVRLGHTLDNDSTLSDLLIEELDTALSVMPATAFDGVDAIPR